ncbi:MAG TPA: hypothetical protein VL986_04415 [Terracidiphilus sp.]|nr:hypothetical protein [Terracidiphilus sp.]
MKTARGLTLLIVCSACLYAQSPATQETPVAPPQADTALDPASDVVPLVPWRVQLDSDLATLGQVRGFFLGQDIIVGGTVQDLGKSSELLEWRIAAADAGSSNSRNSPRQPRYIVPHALDALPERYSGKTARVIAVQLHSPAAAGAAKNALGEAVTDDVTVNPCFDLVARFDDGTIALTTQYPATLATANVAELTSAIGAAGDRMRRELPSIIGKFVFAAGFTQLYMPDSSVEDLAGQNALKRIAPENIPLLEPLQIVAAKYDASAGVVIEVQLPNGDKALSLTTKTQLFAALKEGEDPSFLDKVVGLFLSDIPKDLSKKELAAIKDGSIYRGMREGAVEYVMGFPDKESKGQNGGRQLTFRKSLLVDVSAGGTVEDFRFLDGK